MYDFKTWMDQIEDHLVLDVTISELSRIVTTEYTQLLVGLEQALRNRIITHEDPNLTPIYVIVGYESGVANAYGIKANVDWDHEMIRYPVVTHLFPVRGGRADYGLRILGHKSALNDFCDPASLAHRQILQRFHKLDQFCSGHDLSLAEARNLIVQLLKLQAEHDRDGVGPPYSVITLKKPGARHPKDNAQ